MTVTDELLRNNERYAESFDKGELPLPPAKGVAVVACMDFGNSMFSFYQGSAQQARRQV